MKRRDARTQGHILYQNDRVYCLTPVRLPTEVFAFQINGPAKAEAGHSFRLSDNNLGGFSELKRFLDAFFHPIIYR